MINQINILPVLLLFCVVFGLKVQAQCTDPVIDIASDVNSNVCSGAVINLSMVSSSCTGADTYNFAWSTGVSGVNMQTISATMPNNPGPAILEAIYSVVVINGLDTVGTDSITISILPSMNATIVAASSPPLCVGNDIILNAVVTGGSGNGQTASWTNTDNNTGLQAEDENVVSGTQYSVTVTDSEGCSASDNNTTISINNLPGPYTITGDTGICLGEALNLSASPSIGSFTCVWEHGGETVTEVINCNVNIPITTLSDAGDYTLAVTNPTTQCISIPVVINVVIDELELDIEPVVGPNDLCANDSQVSLGLSPNPGVLNSFTITSSPNVPSAIIGNEFYPQISGPGTFLITYTGNLGHCTKSETAAILVKPLPDIILSPLPTVCNINSSIDLNEFVEPVGGTFTYANGDEFTGVFNPIDTTANFNLEFNYSVTENFCTRIIPGLLEIDPELVATIEADFSICEGTERSLGVVPSGGGGGYSYSWSNPELLENPNVQFPTLLNSVPVGENIFTLSLEDTNGCVATNTQTVNINPQPALTITQDPEVFCEPIPVTLTAQYSGGVGSPEYFWGTNSANGQPDTLSTETIYNKTSIPVRIEFDNITGCNTVQVSYTINPTDLLQPTILSIPESNTVCANQVSVYFPTDRNVGSNLTWRVLGPASNVVDTNHVDDALWVFWADELTGTATIQLEEVLSDDCQTIEELPISFSNDEAPEYSEIYFSELNGILYYNQSGLCYNWGYLNPTPNLNANPPEPYVEYDLPNNQYQSFIIGQQDSTLTYFCQVWSPGDCGNIESSCSNTILLNARFNPSINEPTEPPSLDFKVFPNPNRGQFNFQIGGLQPDVNYTWEVTNTLGQHVENGSFITREESHEGQINSSKISAGLYLFSISKNGDRIEVTRMVVQD